MDGLGFIDIFKGKLKFWSLHCTINALPSYLVVVFLLEQAGNPTAHFAMLSAIATFVIGYSVLTSLPGPLTRKDSLLSRALKFGLTLRMICSIITVLAVPTRIFLLLTPDYWCGNFASMIVAEIFNLLGQKAYIFGAVGNGELVENAQIMFMEFYLVTLLEGLMLSLMLFVFSVFAVVILQMRDRKKFFVENYQQYKSGMD
jgi:hypothetical protein